MCLVEVGKITRHVNSNYELYKNMKPRERFIRITDTLDIDVESYVIDTVLIVVKETRTHLQYENMK